MIIAKLKADQNGILRGQLKSLIGSADLVFKPMDAGADYSIRHEGIESEIGAAWAKDKDGKPFWSVRLNDPFLARPVNCALFHSDKEDGVFNLVWNRREGKQDKARSGA